jgi:hypothetical protein
MSTNLSVRRAVRCALLASAACTSLGSITVERRLACECIQDPPSARAILDALRTRTTYVSTEIPIYALHAGRAFATIV